MWHDWHVNDSEVSQVTLIDLDDSYAFLELPYRLVRMATAQVPSCYVSQIVFLCFVIYLLLFCDFCFPAFLLLCMSLFFWCFSSPQETYKHHIAPLHNYLKAYIWQTGRGKVEKEEGWCWGYVGAILWAAVAMLRPGWSHVSFLRSIKRPRQSCRPRAIQSHLGKLVEAMLGPRWGTCLKRHSCRSNT
jgi:hypothetical protein